MNLFVPYLREPILISCIYWNTTTPIYWRTRTSCGRFFVKRNIGKLFERKWKLGETCTWSVPYLPIPRIFLFTNSLFLNFVTRQRCHEEREARLKSLTSSHKQSMAKATPQRTTKLAYVESVAKAPRGVGKPGQVLQFSPKFVLFSSLTFCCTL